MHLHQPKEKIRKFFVGVDICNFFFFDSAAMKEIFAKCLAEANDDNVDNDGNDNDDDNDDADDAAIRCNKVN